MRLHKEGLPFILLSGVLFAASLLWYFNLDNRVFAMIQTVVFAIIFILVLQFFRNPKRPIKQVDQRLIYAPADGKVVAIEETHDREYLDAPMMQVSIFMSPLNVHVNRVPVSGTISYFKYHPGSYLVASHPKSSLENERATYAIDAGGYKVLMRQIAGAVARRIVSYAKPGDKVVQGEEIGFIKFGSRVDLLIPKRANVRVRIGQQVRGNITVIARVS